MVSVDRTKASSASCCTFLPRRIRNSRPSRHADVSPNHDVLSLGDSTGARAAEQAAAAAARIRQARSPSRRGVLGLSAGLALWAAGGTPVGGGRSGGTAGRRGIGTASQAPARQPGGRGSQAGGPWRLRGLAN